MRFLLHYEEPSVTEKCSHIVYMTMTRLTSMQVRPGDQPGDPPSSKVASLAADF